MDRDDARSPRGSLEDAYEAAWEEWIVAGEQQIWDRAAGDGLETDW